TPISCGCNTIVTNRTKHCLKTQESSQHDEKSAGCIVPSLGLDGHGGGRQHAAAECRRGNISVSYLFQVVFRLSDGSFGRADQLPVHWLRRRHPPASERHGRLRRLRRTLDG